jgi:adenine-specific DNA-methyltransferase
MRVGIEAVRTATERVALLRITDDEEASIAAEELQSRLDKAFDVEVVTKQFFSEVANWYFWALKHTRFPKDAPKEKDGHDHVSVIRLITRLIFCWFVKEKGLIPPDLFDERKLTDLLVDFAPGKVSRKDSVFYKAILHTGSFETRTGNAG